MTIRNLDSYVEKLWDWGIFDGCFGTTRIGVSDLDGIVERKGKFLVIEAKSPGAKVPLGQMRMFRAMADTEVITVLGLWGDPSAPKRLQGISKSGPSKVIDCDLDRARGFVSNWFDMANQSKAGA